MKTICIVLIVICGIITTEAKGKKKMVTESLINALIQVESNGNPNAIGDNGKAKGILQIWEVVIKDVNKFYHTNYTHKDAMDPKKSKEICKMYLEYWGKHYEKTHQKPVTNEIYAKIWNSGPTGYTNPKTISYWNKVKAYLSKQS